MAKSKKNIEELDIFAAYTSETGGNIVSDLDTELAHIDTGNLAINYSCSGKFMTGGLASGRIIELYGPSASAKSLIAMNTAAGAQRKGGIAALIDAENAFNPEFAQRACGIDPKRIARWTTDSIESSFRKINSFSNWVRKQEKFKDIPVIIIYDSISVSPCERELRETQLEDNYTDADYKRIVGGKQQPGERAKIIGNELRKINTTLEKNNVTLLIINQVRSQIGVMYGCFHYNSKVDLADGTSEKIGTIVSQKLPVEVMSYNQETKVIEAKKVIGWHNNGDLQETEKFLQFCIKGPNGNDLSQFACTPNHMIFSYDSDGKIVEKSARDLNIGDMIAQKRKFFINNDQEQCEIEDIHPDQEKYQLVGAEIIDIYEKPPTKTNTKFDLTVEGNHNYFVDGVLVHNSPETTAAGGNALPFYCSQRIRAASQKKIEEKVAGGRKRYVGINLQIANKKNRSTRPFISVDGINLMFETGINPLSGLLGALLDARRISATGSGNFTIDGKYTDSGDEVKFKSSLERNEVPLEVLLANPKLIDAVSSEEITEYLSHFANTKLITPEEDETLIFSDTPNDETES
jgi:recombination protein RecA